ncbi:MAG TPA: SOS response-associated peptidase [Steroidobacteraceae bacterium]|jgi:putative SOS response-associated peptidase YedK|nr:SOS response-associated peptidase [Steroidobacteraceae bacterium]
MCGRYILRMQDKYLREWNLHGPPAWVTASYNIAPTQQVPIMRTENGAPAAAMVRWGLIPSFAQGNPGKFSTINARIETFATAPAFRGAWQRGQRCIQPASGFYEWHLDAQGRKTPFLITLADQELFGFAGLWDWSVRDDGAVIESCAHITMPANALMADIHNGGSHPHRMPAILRREDHEAWLKGTAAEARAVLAPYPADLMVALPVSTRVNSVRNNGPELIESIAA